MQNNQPSIKTALITGAGCGLGKEIAIYLARLGWGLVLHYNSAEDGTMSLYSKLKAAGHPVHTIQCNFNDLVAVRTLFNRVTIKINLLINNAAVFYNDNLPDLDYDSFLSHLNINYITPVMLSHQFVRQLDIQSQGNIINIVDHNIFKAPSNFFSYHSSKAALAHFTKLAARQLAPRIKVNAIALGYVMRNKRCSITRFSNMIENTPLKLQTTIEEVHSAINFIISSPSLTGHIIMLDSGAYLT